MNKMKNYKVLVETTLMFIEEVYVQADCKERAWNKAYGRVDEQDPDFNNLCSTRTRVLETRCLDNE